MAKLKIYAVARGREVGLFTSWAGPSGAQAQIDGFSKALYKSFEGPDARGVALRWLVSTGVELPPELATEAALLVGGQLAEPPPPAETAAPATETKTWHYAVALGRKPGLYSTWYGPDGAKEQITGLAETKYRKFADRDCALIFLHDHQAQLDEALTAEVGAAVAAIPPPPSGRDLEGRPQILMVTDGCARGNGQGGEVRGGWGGVLRSGSHYKERAGGLLNTTNQRAELLAIVHMLEGLPHASRLWLQTDSMTVINGFRAGNHQEPKADVGNRDIWERLAAAAQRHVIEEIVYRSDEHRDVRRCHELANEASQGEQLEPDLAPPATGLSADDEELFLE